jgi:hypothetical protein
LKLLAQVLFGHGDGEGSLFRGGEHEGCRARGRRRGRRRLGNLSAWGGLRCGIGRRLLGCRWLGGGLLRVGGRGCLSRLLAGWSRFSGLRRGRLLRVRKKAGREGEGS